MERARATWTDERLDDLSRRVDHGFNRVDADVRQFRTELNGRFDAVDTKLDALHRLIVQASGGLIIAVVVALVGVAVTGA